MPRFSSKDEAIEAGLPSELENVQLRLRDFNFIGDVIDLAMSRETRLTLAGAVKLGVRQFLRVHEAIAGRFRRKGTIRLTGEDRIILRP